MCLVINPKLSRARNSRNQPGWVGQSKGILQRTQDGQPIGREEAYRARKAIEIDRLLKTNTPGRVGGGLIVSIATAGDDVRHLLLSQASSGI